MLEEFLEANELKAKVLDGNAGPEEGAECALYLSPESRVPLLVVYPLGRTLKEGKLKDALVLRDCREAEESEVERVTGYKKAYLPPVSVWGVRLVLEKSLSARPLLRFQVGEEKVLEISAQDILAQNEGYSVLELL